MENLTGGTPPVRYLPCVVPCKLYFEEVENTFDRKADKSTLAVFLRHWLSAYCVPKLAPNTVNGYRVNVERHIIPYIGQIPLNKLTPANIQKLYADLLTSGLSGTSVRYVHNNLHRALKYAVKQELISRNPADLVDPPRIDHIEMRVLTPDESKTLISGCVGTDIYLPVLLGLSLGLRRGEALGLQWDDIDMDAKTVTIIHSASFRKGGFLLSSTKTRNSRRTLIMPDALYIALKDAYNKQQREAAIFGDGYNSYHLVCCLPDGMPITSGILQHRFHDVLTSCGLPSIRFHDLRHTNATLMLRNRIPAKIVSAMLGHSSIGITMDTYSHVMTDMQEGAIDVMDGLLKGLY